MAVIGKIRRQSGLLMIIIGGALVLFILGEGLSSGSLLFSGATDEVGVINGNKVSYAEFDYKVNDFIQNRYSGRSLDESARLNIREQVWNQIIRENVLLPQYEDLGLTVSRDEIFHVIKNDPNNATLRSYFTDPQTRQIYPRFANDFGGLNSQAVIDYLDQILNQASDEEQGVLDAKNSWKQIQKGIAEEIRDNKYNNVLVKGLYVTKLEAEMDAVERADRVSFSYVVKDYSSITNEEVSYTDQDLKDYYNAHKSEPQFQQEEPVRSVDLISFDVKASEDDVNNIIKELESLKADFTTTDDDTLFVNENASTPFNIKWAKAGTFPSQVDSTIMTGENGTVVGPYSNNVGYEIAKVIGRKMSPDSVQARHILIQIDSTGIDAAKAKADSIKSVIKKQNNFAEMAAQFSVDGSKDQGGDLGWFTEGRMVPEFNDACFDGEKGDMPIVQTQFGIHIIEITDQTAPKEKVLVAVVDTEVKPSTATFQEAYNRASTFAINNNSAENFLSAGNELGIKNAARVRENDPSMVGLENSRQIVKWAFENEVGSIRKEPFDLQDKYVVALIKESREKGVIPFEMVEAEVIAEVLKEKKAEKMMADMSGTDLNAIASKVGSTVQVANDITFSSTSIPGIGIEPELLGMAFTLGQGNTSVPVKGSRGVYVIKIDNVVNNEVANLSPNKYQLESTIAGNSRLGSFNALKEMSELTDNRSKFY